MTNAEYTPSRINFEDIGLDQIRRILKTGDTDFLTHEERSYLSMMDFVRGCRARFLSPGGKKVVTKAGIIKTLRDIYGLSDWMARRVYSDAINFFYADRDASPAAWRNLYAEKADKICDLAIAAGDLKEARAYMEMAAKLRGCFDEIQPEIPQELLDRKPIVVYTSDATALGAPKKDIKALEAFIDSIPDTPEAVRTRLRQDAGIEKRNLLQRLIDDGKEFTEEGD